MKLNRIFGLFLLSQITAFSSFSQMEIVVDSPEYYQAKEAGTLDQYTIIQDLNQQIVNGTAKPVQNSGTPKSSDCDCFRAPDATYTLALNAGDDGSSGVINLPFAFNFYGTLYNSLYINNNGNVTFGSPLSSYSSTAFPSNNNKIIAPFWADVDTRGGNGQVLYKVTPTAIYINWHNVGYYNTQGGKRNTFQLILTNGSDPSIPDGNNVAFCYQDMQWTTGSASCTGANNCSYNGNSYTCLQSSGPGGFCGIPATAGANKGDNVGYFLIGRFDHPGTDFDGPLGNNDGISYLDNKSFFFNITSSSNIPPIAQGVSSCDTFKVCTYGDTADIMITFLSPELNQTTSITYTNGGLNSLQEISNVSGNTANLVLRIIGNPSDAGVYNLTVTATDSYSPTPGVTTIPFVVVIDNSGTNLNPQLSYTPACDEFPVSVLNGPYDGYLWDDQTVLPSTTVDESGLFGVTVNIGNCFKRVEEYIYVPKPANFNLQGNLYLCPGEDSTFLTIGDSLAIDFMNWNTGNPAVDGNFSMWLTPGTYTIYNQDSTGLCTNDTTFTIGQGVPSTIFSDAISCNNLNYQVTGSSAGTGAVWSSPHPEISFSNPTASNPIITASTPGIYTIHLSSPCAQNLETKIVFSFTPTIFPSDTICGNEYVVDPNSVNSLGGGKWSTIDPTIISFSNDTINNPTISTNYVPYSAQVTYTDKYCPSLSASAFIVFVQAGEPTVPAVACNMGTFDLSVNSFQGGTWSIIDNPATSWSEDTAAVFVYGNTVSQPGLTVSTPGVYTVQYEDNFCNTITTHDIYFPPYVYTQINDTMLCYGVTYELNAWQPPYEVDYTWSNGSTGTSITVSQPGDYFVTVSNECHSYMDSARIEYYTCDIEAPNVISLSSQSGNNTWFVNGDGIADFNCVIVNRWGSVIYEFNDVNGSWDGRDRSGNVVTEGVYFYVIKAKIFGGEELEKHGFIQVVH